MLIKITTVLSYEKPRNTPEQSLHQQHIGFIILIHVPLLHETLKLSTTHTDVCCNLHRTPTTLHVMAEHPHTPRNIKTPQRRPTQHRARGSWVFLLSTYDLLARCGVGLNHLRQTRKKTSKKWDVRLPVYKSRDFKRRIGKGESCGLSKGRLDVHQEEIDTCTYLKNYYVRVLMFFLSFFP